MLMLYFSYSIINGGIIIMDQEIKTTGENEPDEAPKPADITDPFEMVDPVNVPEPTDTVEPASVSQPNDMSEPTEKPQSFDMVQPIASPELTNMAESTEVSQSTDVTKPVEDVVPSTEAQTAKPAKKHMGKMILMILLILVIIGAAVGAYFWRDKIANDLEKQKDASITTLNATNETIKTQLAAEIAKNAVATGQTGASSTAATAPSASVAESIKSSVTSGNTAALEGYMAASVNVITAGSEGVGIKTPTQAATSVSTFITGATSPWNFSLTASILSSYGNGAYKQYFPSTAIVGKSANNKVVSFSFDHSAKINTVFLAANESLLQ